MDVVDDDEPDDDEPDDDEPDDDDAGVLAESDFELEVEPESDDFEPAEIDLNFDGCVAEQVAVNVK